MCRKFAFTLALMLVLVPATVFAGLFEIRLESEGQTYRQDFKAVSSVIDELDTDAIEGHFTGYTDASEVVGYIDFRGVDIDLLMPAGQSKIILSIPSIGVYEEFSGTDRDDAVDALEDWFKKDGQSAMTRLMKELAAETATDPIAGNPSSLQSRMVGLDYDYAVNADETIEMNQNAMARGSEINANMISIFARYSNYDLDGVSSQAYSLPLAYTIKFNNSKNSLAFRIPISVVNVDGSEAYNFGFGVGLSYFIKDNWSVTPAVGYTAVGSVDLGSVAQLASGSVTSSYGFQLGKYTLTMGNMLGHYKTLPFEYEDYDVDPDIKNTVLRNGLSLNVPVGKMIKGTSFEFFATDTRYYGSELFIDQYNEFGFSYGFAKIKKVEKGDKVKNVMRKMRIGATYLYADKATGYSVNFGFSF